MRFIIYVVLVFLPFISWSQEKITDWKFLYKITNEEGIELYTNTPFNPQPHHYYELIDSSKTGRFYDLSPGFYLNVSAKGESLQTQLIHQTSISARVINSQKNMMIQVVDSTETIIENAVVTLNGKPLKFDPTTKTFIKKKWNKDNANVLVKAKGEVLVLDLKKDNAYRYKKQKKTKGKFWRKLNPIPLVKKMNRKIWRCIKGKRPSDYYQGYMVLNKPKYRPGDTVKVKGYFINKKKKPLTQNLELRLYKNRKDVLHQQVVSKGKGVYVSEFVLEDSLGLKLDRNHQLYFYDKYKKREYRVMKHAFRYEDYQLDEVTYSLAFENRRVNWGDTIQIVTSGKFKTGLYAPDVNIHLKLKHANHLQYISSGNIFEEDTLLIEDPIIWTHEQRLNPSSPTEIILPDSIFPKIASTYNLEANFTNSNGEIQTKKVALRIDKPKKKKKCLALKLEGPYLWGQYVCADSNAHKKALLYLEGDETEASYITDLPFRRKLNSRLTNYDLNSLDEEQNTYLELEDYNPEIHLDGNLTWDSLKIQLKNPRQISIYFQLYKGKKLIQSGQTLDEFFEINRSNKSNDAYHFYYQYVWSGNAINDKRRFQLLKNKLNIALEQPAVIRPGETVSVKVKVTDSHNRPAKNVDLSAGAINSQFRSINNISAPKIEYRRQKKTATNSVFYLNNKVRSRAKSPLNKKWAQKLNIADQLFYRLRFPEKGTYFQTDTITSDTFYQQIAQFAPFIVRDGKAQPILMIYCNRKLVYYYNVHDSPPYSFVGKPGFNLIQIRTPEYLYTIKNVELQKGTKLNFSIDENHFQKSDLAKFISREKVTPFLTSTEKQLLSKSIFTLLNSKKGHFVIQQGQQNTHIFSTPNSYRKQTFYFRIGPFEQGNIDFFKKNKFSKSLEFEPGFSYQVLPKREKLYQYDWLTNDSLPTVLPLKSPDDLIYSPHEIDRFFNSDFNLALQKNEYDYENKNGKYSFQLPKDSIAMRAVILENADSIYKVLEPVLDILNLPSDKYTITIVLKDGSYLQQSFHLPQRAFLFQNLSAKTYQTDSTQSWLKRILLQSDLNEEAVVKQLNKALYFEKTKAKNRKIKIASGEFHSITGVIIDQKSGEPLIGANVWIKGTDYGTTTNHKGTFRLNAPPHNFEIEISYVGMSSKTIQLNPQQRSIHIKLNSTGVSLDEIVVTTRSSSKNSLIGVFDRPLATRNAYALAGSTAGLSQADRGDEIFIRGSRSGDTNYYLDGIRISAGQLNTNDFQLRSLFRDDAYWQPQLVTDENGEAYFQATFPDNTTQWKSYVIGMNKKRQAGFGFADVNAYKQVMAQLSIPRFLIEGDEVNIVGKSLNYTGDTLNVKTEFKVEDKTVQSKNNQLAEVVIEKTKIVATDQDSLQLTYSLSMEKYGDGEQKSIPIFRKGVKEHQGDFHFLENDTMITLAFDTSLGAVHVRAETNHLDFLEESIDYLIRYPHGCNEQTASKLIATLLGKQLKIKGGLEFKEEAFIKAGLSKLEQRQHLSGFWGWWSEGQANIWMTTYVLNVLHEAKKQNYNSPALEKGLLFLTGELDRLEGRYLLDVLELLSDVGQALDYTKYLTKVSSDLEKINLNDEFTILKIRQSQGLPHSLASLESKMQKTFYDGFYWGESNLHWYNNDLQISLLAYQICKKANRTNLTKGIERFLLRKRGRYAWGNTFLTARILLAILPKYLDQEGTLNFKAALEIESDEKSTVEKFPFEKALIVPEKLIIRKKGNAPVFLAAYQDFWNTNPQKQSDIFTTKSEWIQNGKTSTHLEAGKATQLKVSVEIKKAADYLMLEIPIPSGCSYGEKKRSYYHRFETHREYFKDRVAIYCHTLKVGTYEFVIDLEPRFSGSYTLNPAKIEQMYFPVVFGRNEIKTVEIK